MLTLIEVGFEDLYIYMHMGQTELQLVPCAVILKHQGSQSAADKSSIRVYGALYRTVRGVWQAGVAWIGLPPPLALVDWCW